MSLASLVDALAARVAAECKSIRSSITSLSSTVSGKEPSITGGTTAQYWRGDKSWQALNKAAVGLGLVDNTSDIGKPISTAQQSALDVKVDYGQNLFNGLRNPTFEDGTPGAHWVLPTVTAGSSSVFRSGTNSMHLVMHPAAPGDVFVGNGVQTNRELHPKVRPGERWRAELWILRGITTSPAAIVSAFIRVKDKNGVTLQTVQTAAVQGTATWQLLAPEIDVTDVAADYIVCGLTDASSPDGNTLRVDDLRLSLVEPRNPVVAAASTANIASLAGAITVDGVTLAADAGNLILVKNQTSPAQNGVYNVSSGTWTRASGFSVSDPTALYGGHVRVAGGTTQGGTIWATSFTQANTLDATAMNWFRLATSSDLAGLPSTADVAAKANAVIFDRITSNFSTASSAYVATGLSITLPPGTYVFRARGAYQSSATTTGIGIRLGGTNVNSAFTSESVITSSGNSSASPVFTRVATATVQAISATTGVQLANSPFPWTVEGFIIVTGQGSLSVDICSQDGVGTVRINAHSMITAQKIA